MKSAFKFSPLQWLVLLAALILTCSPSRDKPTQPTVAPVQHFVNPETDPFTGLLVSEAHLPWVFRHGVGPKPPAAGFEKLSHFPQPPPPPEVEPPSPPRVLRVQPTGEIQDTRAISIAFSLPMVALSDVDQMREQAVPATLTPAVPGRWRWLGTTLLVFEPAGPLPGATPFTVTVPKGARSAQGTETAETTQFTFSTPPLQIEGGFPSYGGAHPETPIVLHLNQKVDPAAIRPYLRIEKLSENGDLRPVRWRLLTREQFLNNEMVKKYSLEWVDQKTVALLPDSLLQRDSEYTFTLRSGAPSAEGPLRTDEDQTRSFSTIGPMKVKRLTCVGRSPQPCRPSYNWSFEFTNKIEVAEEELGKYFKVVPEVQDLKIESWGNGGVISGDFKPATTYTVTILAGVEDTHRQKLATSHTATIQVGDEEPQLQIPMYPVAVVEDTQRTLPIPVVNNLLPATVRLYRIKPKDLFSVHRLDHARNLSDHRALLLQRLGAPAATFEVQFNSKPNAREIVALPLDKALRGKNGVLFVDIDSPSLRVEKFRPTFRNLILQVTSLGLTVSHDRDRLHILATGLGDGQPRGGVPLRIYRDSEQPWSDSLLVWEGKTGPDGTITIPWPAQVLTSDKEILVIAGDADDMTYLRLGRPGAGGRHDSTYRHQVGSLPLPARLRSMVFSDRDPYRPGETVELNGWLRSETAGTSGRLEHIAPASPDKAEVEWTISSPDHETVAKGRAPIDRDGALHVRWKAPLDATLGRYHFYADLQGIEGHEYQRVQGEFSVLAYRAPEHVVHVTIAPKSYVFGDRLAARVEGRYTFGAPMRKAGVEYVARLTTADFLPPKNPEFDFGFVTSWRNHASMTALRGKGQLDEHGVLLIDDVLPKPGTAEGALLPARLTLEATVTDLNRQGISARQETLVHPALVYTGLRLRKNLIREGETVTIEGVVVDLEGNRKTGTPVKVRALLESWKRKPADRLRKDEDAHERNLEEKGACTFTSGARPASCAMKMDTAGTYLLEGSSVDDQGRPAVTRIGLYVLGKSAVEWSPDHEDSLGLALDRDEPYKPGEKVKLIVRAPFFPAVGTLSLEREGLISTRLIHVKSSIHVEEIPVEEKHIPNLWASVTLVRGRQKKVPDTGGDPGRPRMVTGRVMLPIHLASKKISIAVKPSRNVVAPGATVDLDLAATGGDGAPVRARLTVMLVDEGVLSLFGFTLPDPLAVFFPERFYGTTLLDVRRFLLKKPSFEAPWRTVPELPDDSMEASRLASMAAPPRFARPLRHALADLHGPDGSLMSGSQEPTSTRTNGGPDFSAVALRRLFASTAYFNDRVLTNADGRITLRIPMPENLTTYRVMILAMDTKTPDRFGSADGRITVRRDFMLRPALPRFANFGDVFEASVVLNSLTDRAGTAEVKLSGTGFEVLGPNVQSVSLSSRKTEELRFRVKTVRPGEARFSFAGHYLGLSDGVTAPAIPVHVPASTENTAVYGMTDGAVLQPIVPPRQVFPQFGGLDLHLSSTGLSGLQDATRHLIENDHRCSEALASRLVPIFALQDIIPQFKLGSAADLQKLNDLAVRGIKELLKYQNGNGGFRLWPGDRTLWGYASAYVTWALLRAREAGFEVPVEKLEAAAKFLSDVLNGRYDYEYWWYYNYSMQIHAAWVLTELARVQVIPARELERRKVATHLERLYGERDKVGFLARAWLLHALWRLDPGSAKVKTLLRDLENSAVETAAGAHFDESANPGAAMLMHSSARTDAVVLRVLLDLDPQHILLPKIVRGLMASRKNGGWETSQGNAFVLDALAAYFRVVEAEVPDFTSNAWYDRLYAGTKHFKGRSMDIVHARLPMKTLLEQGAGGMILSKQGPGRLYYRIGLAYVPAALELPAQSQGLTVSRSYESMEEDASAVVQVAPGRWRVKAGATVLVKLTMHAPDRRDFVALTDPLPAGFEGLDRQLETAPQLPMNRKSGSSTTGHSYFWWWSTPTHQELRDDRFVAYYDTLHAGTYEYAYRVRATTLGTFTAPPVRALEMYHPEVFGRSAREVVEVVP